MISKNLYTNNFLFHFLSLFSLIEITAIDLGPGQDYHRGENDDDEDADAEDEEEDQENLQQHYPNRR